MISQENFKQEIFEFADKKYGNKFEEFYDEFIDEFPYGDYELDDDDELYFKNFLDWLIIEKPLPETGITIVEEFVKDNPDISDDFKQSLLRMKNFVRGKFKVISISDSAAVLEKIDTGENYDVKFYDNMNKDLFVKDRIIKGRIHEFDEQYRFCGAFIVKIRNPKNIDILDNDYSE